MFPAEGKSERIASKTNTCRRIFASSRPAPTYVRAKSVHRYRPECCAFCSFTHRCLQKQIAELSRQQPIREQERTNKKNDFNRKNEENQIKQQEINLLNAQLESMNRNVLQEKKHALETTKEKLLKAQNALILLGEKAALNIAEESLRSLELKLQARKTTRRTGKQIRH